MGADEGFAAAEDGADTGLVIDDFGGPDAVFLEDFEDFLGALWGGCFVEIVPVVGCAGFEGLVADGDDPAAVADADVGGVEEGVADGQDFAFGAAVWAEPVF